MYMFFIINKNTYIACNNTKSILLISKLCSYSIKAVICSLNQRLLPLKHSYVRLQADM